MLKNTRALKRNLKMSTYQRFSEITKHIELAEKFLAEDRSSSIKTLFKYLKNFIKQLRRLLRLLQNSLTFHRLKKLRRLVDGEQIYYTKLLQFYL
jgi:hypothetical protein